MLVHHLYQISAIVVTELDVLAAYEHSYWLRYKKSNGWRRGDALDWTKRTDPDLLRWESLSADRKYTAYKLVKSWPALLAKANFKIERLKFSEQQ